MLLIFIFLICHPTVRVAVLSEFETISSCRTWCGTDFFSAFLTSSINEGCLVSDTRTISSCWTWYAYDIHFPFLSPHYQSRRVISIRNNIELLDLVWYWFFSAFFNLNEQWGSPCYQTLEQYQVAGIGMLMMFFPLLAAIYRSRCIFRTWNNTKMIDLVWYWFFCSYFSPHYQSRRVITIENNIKLLDLVWYYFFSAFSTSPSNESRLIIRH